MSEEPGEAYPLSWPAGWPRTPAHNRRAAPFHKIRSTYRPGATPGQGYTSKSKEKLDVGDGVARLTGELRRLGAQRVVISSNLRRNLDGSITAAQRKMLDDPGIAVYFRLKGKALALACDKWQSAAENMAALAGHIEAIRASDRYGVGTMEQAFAGYKALPADSAANWRQVFGFGASELVSPTMVQSRYRDRAKAAHPDTGGTDEQMMHLNRARDFALSELGG